MFKGYRRGARQAPFFTLQFMRKSGTMQVGGFTVEMVDNADVVLAFHNGESGGTLQCAKYAKNKGKEVRIIRVKSKGAGNK